jgi:hypothetical protein
MVASQFNCLEMISPDRLPRDGVAIYSRDKTQGPVCAMACPVAVRRRRRSNCAADLGAHVHVLSAPTVHYRPSTHTHLPHTSPLPDGLRQLPVPRRPRSGRGRHTRLDLLADVGRTLGNQKQALWTMRNGYALPTSTDAFRGLCARLSHDPSLCAAAEGALRVGVHADTQVRPPLTDRVTQVLCSALPVAHARGRLEEAEWEPFARLVLRGAYGRPSCQRGRCCGFFM